MANAKSIAPDQVQPSCEVTIRVEKGRFHAFLISSSANPRPLHSPRLANSSLTKLIGWKYIMELKITKENAGQLAENFTKDDRDYWIKEDNVRVRKDVQIQNAIGKTLQVYII